MNNEECFDTCWPEDEKRAYEQQEMGQLLRRIEELCPPFIGPRERPELRWFSRRIF